MILSSRDTERPKARNLEPNLGDVPTEIVRSPQFGVKRPGKAFLGLRGAGCAAFGRRARNMRSTQPGVVLKIGAGAGFDDSVWLCSTHPKPSRTMFRGLPAPFWPPGPEQALSISGVYA